MNNEDIKMSKEQIEEKRLEEIQKELREARREIVKGMCKWVKFCLENNMASIATIEAIKVIIKECEIYRSY